MTVRRGRLCGCGKTGGGGFVGRVGARKSERSFARGTDRSRPGEGVVTDPADFERVAGEIESAGETTLATRLELARKVFATTSRYDGIITTELERLSASSGRVTLEAKPALPERVHFALRRQQELRYGENPHQAAALYVPAGRAPQEFGAAQPPHGQE